MKISFPLRKVFSVVICYSANEERQLQYITDALAAFPPLLFQTNGPLSHHSSLFSSSLITPFSSPLLSSLFSSSLKPKAPHRRLVPAQTRTHCTLFKAGLNGSLSHFQSNVSYVILCHCENPAAVQEKHSACSSEKDQAHTRTNKSYTTVRDD